MGTKSSFKKFFKKMGHHLSRAHQHYKKIVPKEGRKMINSAVRNAGKAAVDSATMGANAVGGPIAGAVVKGMGDRYARNVERKLSRNSNKGLM